MTHPIVLAVTEGDYPLNEGGCPNCGSTAFEVTYIETTKWAVNIASGDSPTILDLEGDEEPTKVNCGNCGLELVREGVCADGN